MSTARRRKNTSVVKQLAEDPSRFSFGQAVRLLELSSAYRVTRTDKATANPIGRFVPSNTEFARFKTHQSLSFPAAELAAVYPKFKEAKLRQWNLDVNFIGLTGASGVLPHHYTETLLQRNKAKDHSLWHFLDLFNHRTTSLFARAAQKYRLPLEYERHRLRSRSSVPGDPHSQVLLSLIGMGTRHLTGRLYTKDESLIRYGGLLSQKVRSATGLAQIIRSHFSIPARVEQFIGQWQELIDDVRTRLPGGHNKGQNHCLGRNTLLGKQAWFAQGKISIVIGPLSRDNLHKFAPGTPGLRALDELVRLYVNFEHDHEFVMRIRRADIPNQIRLSGKNPPVMGWNTWLSSGDNKIVDINDTADIPVSSRQIA